MRAQRYDKFRQVNRFLELVEDVLPALPAEGPLRVVDFGSGKSYLTFALHHLLTVVHQREVEIVGLDLKADVVDHCEALARTLGADGLRFEVGDIARVRRARGRRPRRQPPRLRYRHRRRPRPRRSGRCAGDPRRAVLPARAAPQLERPALDPLLRHGTLRERFAAEVTDAARAQLLGAVGYDVQVVEFIELEHTPKNILLRATARPGRDTAKAYGEYQAFAAELGIDPALARLLADRLPA